MADESERVVFAFNGGEVSPRFGARLDVEKFSSSCRQLLNMTVSDFGVATRRPGLQFISVTKASEAVSS